MLFQGDLDILSALHLLNSPSYPYCNCQDLILFSLFLFLNFLKFYFIYLFLAALGLCYRARALSSCGEQGLLFVAVRGLLVAVASLVAEHGL